MLSRKQGVLEAGICAALLYKNFEYLNLADLQNLQKVAKIDNFVVNYKVTFQLEKSRFYLRQMRKKFLFACF